MSAKWEYAIFRKHDAIHYPDPFDSARLPSKDLAVAHIQRRYKESGWKWLEVRRRPAPAQWTRCADDD